MSLCLIFFRFCFTQLDPESPTRRFSFVLQVNSYDKYELVDCQPIVDEAILEEVCVRLNQSNDMGFLTRRMRKSNVSDRMK